MELAMINDDVFPILKIDPAYLDRGIYFGDGVYEVLRSYDGQIFALDEHLERFDRSLREIWIDNIDIKEVRRKVLETYQKSGFGNARMYFHITRGSEPRNHLPGKNLNPNFFLTVNELLDKPGEKEHGIKVCTYPDLRWKRCDIKSLNLLPNVMAKMVAEKKGCYEAILVNDAGEITEGSGSAFFAVDAKQKALITRPLGSDILPSITRSVVVKIAKNCGLGIIEKNLTPAQAAQCEELIMAVTTKDIVPIVQFDGQTIGTGTCGKHTRALIEEFAKLARHR
ncbi:MAG TPA: aminotransferase class IV [Anaerohalosphaeraceae bacterium]|nr:aminotransferase class IV [Anaerohalosphaeraceae bacterium]